MVLGSSIVGTGVTGPRSTVPWCVPGVTGGTGVTGPSSTVPWCVPGVTGVTGTSTTAPWCVPGVTGATGVTGPSSTIPLCVQVSVDEVLLVPVVQYQCVFRCRWTSGYWYQ